MQRQFVRIPVRPGSESRLTTWIRGLDGRRTDLERVLQAEGIQVEVVALDRSEGNTDLLIYTGGPDLTAASAAFARSADPVDVEFKQIMAECLELDRARIVEVLLSWP